PSPPRRRPAPPAPPRPAFRRLLPRRELVARGPPRKGRLRAAHRGRWLRVWSAWRSLPGPLDRCLWVLSRPGEPLDLPAIPQGQRPAIQLPRDSSACNIPARPGLLVAEGGGSRPGVISQGQLPGREGLAARWERRAGVGRRDTGLVRARAFEFPLLGGDRTV